MTRFSAVFGVRGQLRRMSFDAETLEEAQLLAEKWGVAVEGEARETPANSAPALLPEGYDWQTAGKMIAAPDGLSRATMYRLVAAEELDKVPGTRRFLVTRESIERYCRRSKKAA